MKPLFKPPVGPVPCEPTPQAPGRPAGRSIRATLLLTVLLAGQLAPSIRALPTETPDTPPMMPATLEHPITASVQPEALQALPLGAVKPLGWLREQLQANLDGFTGHLDELVPDLIRQDDIYGAHRLSPSVQSKDVGAQGVPEEDRAQFLWWNSETQSNWWDGYIRTAVLLGDEKALQRSRSQVQRLLSTQDADGYLGIYTPALRYRFNSENGELWSKATALRYLLGWHDATQDPKVYEALQRACDDLMRNYPAGKSHPFRSSRPDTSGLSHGLAITDVLEGMYRKSGDKRYLDYLLFCHRDFNEQDLAEDAQLARLLRPELPLRGHGVHTYEHLRSVAAAHQASGDARIAQALRTFLEKIDRCVTASGGPVGDEFIAGRGADSTTRGYEYCSLQELLHSYAELLLKTGRTDFAERIERLFFNAAQGARHPGGEGIAYLKSDNSYEMSGPLNGDPAHPTQCRYKYSPAHQDAAVCCVPNAGRIAPYFIQHMWMRRGDTLVASLLGPCAVETEIGGHKVRIEERTGYPRGDTLEFRVTTQAPVVTLQLRRPAWAARLEASEPFVERDGFLLFTVRGGAGTRTITLALRPETLVHRDARNEIHFTHGALVLAHELKARETVAKVHRVEGFRDLHYKPVERTLLLSPQSPLIRREADGQLRFEAELLDAGTGKPCRVSLRPMGETLLRQVSFPIAPDATQAATDTTREVNVFSGTDGTGHTFPGPCLPFGLVQPGPDNRDLGWDHTSGYQYRDPQLLGFSQTHLSGTGISELGDILLLPSAGWKPDRSSTRYKKASETGEPGYYAVELEDGVKAELTCTERVALHRYTFPGEDATVRVDLQHGLRFMDRPLVVDSQIHIDSPTQISGTCRTDNWVKRRYSFVLVFDQPATEVVTLPANPGDKAPRQALRFRLGAGRSLQVKVALSSVGVEGARANMLAEQPGWSFDATRQAARTKWNELLRRIEIDADPGTRRIFYTALYHLLIHPTNLADVDGSYRGADDRIHRAEGGAYYTTLSLWDTYRAAFPLLTIVVPERVDGIVRSLLAHHRAQGYLPIWTAWGQENHCMIGNHAIPVIAAAHRRGFRGFDAGEALQAMVQSSTVPHLNSDWALLDRHGYYPFDLVPTEAVSRSLETAYDDHCVASLARELGKQDLARTFERRSLRHRNLHDPETRLMRGRDSQGNWRTPFDPVKATSPMNNPGDYTEANAWQYTWTPAQFDLEGMIRLMGGRSAFTGMLDQFFSLKADNADKFLGQEAMIGQYAHGNEPCHHVIWLYAFSDRPGRVGELARRICADFYKDAPDGLLGNDDCGQMSAWYVFATLGFYPLDPSSGDYVLGTPLVRRARLRVPGLPVFEILGTGQEKGEVLLDGRLRLHTLLPHSALTEGGSLEFR